MIYFYYNDLMQPSDRLVKSEIDQLADITLENFKESLDKKHGYQFNTLINILNLEEIDYKIKQGFDHNSDDEQICNFEKISFVFNKTKDIDSIIEKYGLDGIFDIEKNKKNYIFIAKNHTIKANNKDIKE